MEQPAYTNILVAEDNDVSRDLMTAILQAQGYRVFGAVDGESAIKVVEDRQIDLAIVDINMAPKGGMDFARWLLVSGVDLPVIMITGDDSSHVLMEATSLGVAQIVQKPVVPERLIQMTARILRRRGINPAPLNVNVIETKFSPDDLMKRAVDLAHKNATSKRGGPFGAVVADADGNILGEGVNGITSRADPTAHAEVMAIRRAADRLNRADLSDCVLYCSSEPTDIGKALIRSVGIKTVYYGLSHEELGALRQHKTTETNYHQLRHDDALEMFRQWQALKGGVDD